MDGPKRDDALRSSWLVYSLAISAPPAGMSDGTELELRVNREPYTLVVRDGRFEARQGEASIPVAVIDAPSGPLFRLATGQARRGELETARSVVIRGDKHAARRFLEAARGAWHDPSPVVRS
jgi:hypothetical protein